MLRLGSQAPQHRQQPEPDRASTLVRNSTEAPRSHFFCHLEDKEAPISAELTERMKTYGPLTTVEHLFEENGSEYDVRY
jgi:hypothetical protein